LDSFAATLTQISIMYFGRNALSYSGRLTQPTFSCAFFVSIALSFALWFAGVLGRIWISLWYYEDV